MNKPNKQGKGGERVFPAPREHKLRLLRLNSECSTTDLISELSQKAKELVRGMERKHVMTNGDSEPDAT